MSFSKKDVSSEPGESRTVLTDKGSTTVLHDYHKHSQGVVRYFMFPFDFFSKTPLPVLEIDSKSWHLTLAIRQAS